jgi:hypothetical protein
MKRDYSNPKSKSITSHG